MGNDAKNNLYLADLKLPFRNASWLYVPGAGDIRWRKHFRVDLDAAGGADPDATILLGVTDTGEPQVKAIIEDILYQPDDLFAFINVTVEAAMLSSGSSMPYNPERKIDSTADAAVVTPQLMNSREFLVGLDQVFSLTFTNTGLVATGYEGIITGRILRGGTN